MKITDALLGEHGAFYAQFEHIERALANGASLESIRGLAAMLAAALAPHAHMEDQLLFGPAVAAGAPAEPMAVMHQDHEGIEGALEETQDAPDAASARALLLGAIREAREHFAKEERIAFGLAAHALGDERLRELGSRWALARGVILEAA